MKEAGKYFPPVPPEVYERAWELYAQHSWREVARILTSEGYPCVHETARSWGFKGKALVMAKEDLDPNVQRYRSAEWLEQWMSRLTKMADELDADGKVTVLDILNQFKWMFRERARLIGTDMPTSINLRTPTEEPEPQEFIQRMVGRDPEETFDPNGRR
jgi:hypothetical protein